MSIESSATVTTSAALPGTGRGLGWGLLGVLGFSLTIPLTRIAVAGLSPLFIGAGRAVVAGLLAAAALLITRQRPPHGSHWLRLAVVAGGVVIGFPLLTSFALLSVPAAQGAVVVALLPAVTAVVAVVRTGERSGPLFWAVTAVGAVAALAFAAVQGGGFSAVGWADLLLFGAVLAAAVGYAEGGLLARELGAWQTVSWALVLALPLMSVLAALAWLAAPPTGTAAQWAAFGYLAAVSMFLAFFAWYRGLAIGPMAQVSQVQLVQPVLSLGWAAVLLHERLTTPTLIGGLVVIACAAGAVRLRARTPARAARPDARTSY